jgi:hypothetical protein
MEKAAAEPRVDGRQPYTVHLLSTNTPQVDDQEILRKLRMRCGRVDLVTERPLSFGFPDYPVRYVDGTVVALVTLIADGKLPEASEIDAALQQSWDWPEARAAAAVGQHTLIVTQLFAAGLIHDRRLELFHKALLSVIETGQYVAIYWKPSQRFVGPADYVRRKTEMPPDVIYPAVNVRMFRITNRAPGELVMDSVGLSALGLPDVQCHFVGLPPRDVAKVLYNTAYYLYERGDAVQDGQTVTGVSDEQRWRCRHEKPLVGPDRVVLDLNPGPTFAAGRRP